MFNKMISKKEWSRLVLYLKYSLHFLLSWVIVCQSFLIAFNFWCTDLLQFCFRRPRFFFLSWKSRKGLYKREAIFNLHFFRLPRYQRFFFLVRWTQILWNLWHPGISWTTCYKMDHMPPVQANLKYSRNVLKPDYLYGCYVCARLPTIFN